ncbi:MAG: S41 family peptidase [Candidatus Eremiobacteraeota bacterium]|nr:S41 family peptidase [Candidatus Eremiobacteraeota bacterium]
MTVLVFGCAQAAGSPSLSTPAISPSGSQIAFVSGGKIWTANSTGGTARILIADGATDDRPVYAPDAKQLAFTSTRSGYANVYVFSLATGAVRRLTYNDANEQLDGWSRDGWIYFSTSSHNIEGRSDIDRVRATGGTPMPIITQPYVNQFYAAPSPNGENVAFNLRGLAGSQWWRNGNSHIDDSQIWIRRGLGPHPQYEQLTDGGAKEIWPMWAPDGAHLYYMSDRTGSENIWEHAVGGAARALTHFHSGRVLWPAICACGDAIVFERDFEIWRLDTHTGNVRRIAVDLQGVLSDNDLQHVTRSNHFSEYQLSPDGKKLAFIVHGRLFAVGASGGPAFAVSRSGEDARELSWAPDSNTLAFASGSGHEDRIFTYDFLGSVRTALTNTPSDIRYLTYDPTARGSKERLAFEQAGAELRVLNVADRTMTTLARGLLPLTPGEPDRALVWSPDGRWIAYFDSDARSFTNVKIANVQNRTSAYISFLADVNTNTLSWSPNGESIIFDTGQRTEPAQLAVVSLVPKTPTFVEDRFHQLFKPNGAAAPTETSHAAAKTTAKKSTRIRIDFSGVHDRLEFLPTGLDVNAQSISPDGKTILITGVAADQQNLYLYPVDDDAHAVARQITASAGQKSNAQWAPDGKSVYYLNDAGAIETISLHDLKAAPVSIEAEFDQNFNSDKLEAFTQAWSAIRDFYADAHTNGVDWTSVYRRFLPQFEAAQNPPEMRRLLLLMIGELNSSHTGVYAPPSGLHPTIGRLGLSFDRVAYESDGTLPITGIVPQSPAAVSAKIAIGDRLIAVNGSRVGRAVNLQQLLDNTVDKKVVLTVSRGGSERTVPVKPVDLGSIAHLRYREWVANNRNDVDRLSGGRLGYVHLADMEPESLAQFYKDLDTFEFSKRGVVIDVRGNNGGFVNAYALDVLSRKPYLLFTSRNQPTSPVREVLGQRALEKPTVLITNEETLSDGEDFTQGYEAMHLGKVVGEPTAGWIIFTSAIRLIDGTVFRLPSTKVATLAGKPMEMHPRPVDIRVQRAPDTTADAQLQTAVNVLLGTK